MKVFKKFFTIVLIAVLVVSCNKDDDSVPEPRKNLLLKKTDSDGNTVTYTYDSNNQLINTKSYLSKFPNDLENYDYVYNPDGTLKNVTNAFDGSIVHQYFYDSNRKLIGGDNTYTYKDNVLTGLLGFTRNTYIYDVKGNIVIQKYDYSTPSNPWGTHRVTWYTYDDKMNPEFSLPEAYNFPRSVNNVKNTYYETGSNLYTNVYEYNSDNYPIKMTRYSGTDGKNYLTITYEYKRL